MSIKPNLASLTGFDWDSGNQFKSWEKHHVDFKECEEIFFNQPLLIFPDPKHSKVEQRYQALGQTNTGRKIFLSFTIREQKIRTISARDQHAKERKSYETKT